MTLRLTRDELRELTGSPIRRRQIDWLREHAWRHEIDVHGWPVVSRAYYERRMIGAIEPQPRRPVAAPDFTAA